jgi:hypothetical protein
MARACSTGGAARHPSKPIRWSGGVALQAKLGETVHAPPFEAVALRVGLLFGEDPD